MRHLVCGPLLLLLLLAGPATAAPCDSQPTPLNTSSPQWNGWGATLTNDRFQRKRDAGLSAADIPRLELKWAFGYPGAASAGAQPSIVGNRIFVGSLPGIVYSLDLNTGCSYWTFAAGAEVRSAVTIANGAAFFADAAGTVYSLNANTGQLRWKHRVDAHPAVRTVGGTLLGTLVGLFFGLPGLLLGPFIGALLGELAAGNSVLRSAHVGASTWLGLIFGTIIKLVVSVMMVAMFGAVWWWNRGP